MNSKGLVSFMMLVSDNMMMKDYTLHRLHGVFAKLENAKN